MTWLAVASALATLDPHSQPYATAVGVVLAIVFGGAVLKWAGSFAARVQRALRRPIAPVRSRPAGPSPGAIDTSWRSYVAEGPAWAIVGGAMLVSYSTQKQAVERHGFASWEAVIWATSTDLGTVACLFLVREGVYRGTSTWGAWLLSIACALMSVQFNVVDGIQSGDWLAVEAHLWMPVLALGVWYWTLHGRHRKWVQQARTEHTFTERQIEPAETPAEPISAPRTASRRVSEAERMAMIGEARELLSSKLQRRPSDEEIAAHVTAAGHTISASRVRYYLPKLRQAATSAQTTREPTDPEVVAWHGR
jgi:hypothetical protein